MITGTGAQASTGIWPESLNNPSLPDKCGLNVALVMDLSYSVQEASALPQLKAAAKGLTQSLVGTASQVGLYTFGISAPAMGTANQNRPLTPVSTQAGADTVNGWIDGMSITTPESTNWDRGLYQVAQQQNALRADEKMYDLVIVITDGNPTRYGIPGTTAVPSDGIQTRYAEMEQAIFSANAIKARGTRIVAVGVGDGVTGSGYNLAAVSGPVANSDYYAVGWEQAAETLQQLALKGCAAETTGSLTVIKQLVPEGVTDLTQGQPLGGWTMDASSPDALLDGQSSTSGVTSVGTGAVSFNVDFADAPSADVSIDENVAGQSPPYNNYVHLRYPDAANPADPANANAQCTLLTADGTQPLAVTDGAGDAFSVTMAPGDIVSCVIYNQIYTGPNMTVQVDKSWNIDGQTYAQGTQPPEFSATYSFQDVTDPANPVNYPNLAWGTTYPNLTTGTAGIVTENVSLPDGCYWVSDVNGRNPSSPGGPDADMMGVQMQPVNPATGAAIAGDGPYNLAAPTQNSDGSYTATSYQVTIDQGGQGTVGANRWKVTNTVTCHPMMVLAKIVNNSPDLQLPAASPFDWSMTATNEATGDVSSPPWYEYPSCDQAPPGEPCYARGDYAIAQPFPVDAGTSYILNESSTAAGSGAYVQDTIGASDEVLGNTSGSWLCWGLDPNTGAYLGQIGPAGTSGQVTIPYGVPYVECAAVNSTAEFSATKQVVGGSATAADWSYSLTPTGTVAAGAPSISDAAWGQPERIRPGQQYTVNESSGPSNYALTDLKCTWDSPSADGSDVDHHVNESIINNPVITVASNTAASCVFTNSAKATLTLTKRVSTVPDPLEVGSLFTYYIDVTAGPDADATNVSVTDPVPAGLDVVSVSTATPGWTVGHTGNAVTGTAANMTKGSTVTIAVEVRVLDGFTPGEDWINTACVVASNVDGQTCDSVTVPPPPPPPGASITLVKRVSTVPDPLEVGSLFTYYVDVTAGPDADVTDVSVSDPVPDGLDVVSVSTAAPDWTVGHTGNAVTGSVATMPKGTTVTIAVEVRVLDGFTPGEDWVNTACVTASNVEGQSCDTVTVPPPPPPPGASLTLVKRVSTVPDPLEVGSLFTYYVDVTAGPDADVTDVSVSDPVPDGLEVISVSTATPGWTVGHTGNAVTGSVATMPKGTTVTIAVEVRVLDGFTPGEDWVNTACVTASNVEGQSCDTVTVPPPPPPPGASLTLVKRVSTLPDPIAVGSLFTYYVDVTAGPDADVTDVSVSDPVPDGLDVVSVSTAAPGWTVGHTGNAVTGSVATMPKGTTVTIAVEVRVLDGFTPGEDWVNTACVTGSNVEGQSCDTVTVPPPPPEPGASLTLVKRVSTLPDPIAVGSLFTYYVDVTAGPDADVSDVSVSDPVPDGLDVVSVSTAAPGWTVGHIGNAVTGTTALMAKGTTITIAVEVRVLDGFTPGEDWVNTACVTGSNVEGQSCDTVTVPPPPPEPGASLTLVKRVSTLPDPIAVGSLFTYYVDVTAGPDADVTDVSVSDPVPDGLDVISVSTATPGWTVGHTGNAVTGSVASMPKGTTVTIAIEVRVLDGFTPGEDWVNTACVTGSNVEGQSCDTVTVPPPPPEPGASLTLTKRVSTLPDPIAVGSLFTYYVDVTAGPDADVTNVSVSDPVPAGLEVVTVTTGTTGWTVGHSGNAVTGSVASMPKGTTVTIVVEVRVLAGFTAGEQWVNTACATGANVEGQSCDTVTVPPPPPDPGASLTLVKRVSTLPDPLEVGSLFTYYLDVTAGPDADVTDVSVSDPVPDGLDVVSVSTAAPGWTVGHTGNAVTGTVASMPKGTTVTIAVEVRVLDGFLESEPWVNTACANGSNARALTCDTVVVPPPPPEPLQPPIPPQPPLQPAPPTESVPPTTPNHPSVESGGLVSTDQGSLAALVLAMACLAGAALVLRFRKTALLPVKVLPHQVVPRKIGPRRAIPSTPRRGVPRS
ncbi:MAG: VWA domain-containing protein [Propionibacteriaceae bacterium]|nr:VWA domain-containing protein [Propionibacteriaceae bacterium]